MMGTWGQLFTILRDNSAPFKSRHSKIDDGNVRRGERHLGTSPSRLNVQRIGSRKTGGRQHIGRPMPFSAYDDATRQLLHQVLDGALIVLETMASDSVSPNRRAETIARMTSQLVAAAADGDHDFQSLQLKALDGIV